MCIGWLSLGHICGSHQSIYAGSDLWPIYMALIRAYMWLSLGHICWLYIGHICWLSLVADIHGSHQGIYVALIRAYMLAQIYGSHWLSLLVALIMTMTLYIYILGWSENGLFFLVMFDHAFFAAKYTWKLIQPPKKNLRLL